MRTRNLILAASLIGLIGCANIKENIPASVSTTPEFLNVDTNYELTGIVTEDLYKKSGYEYGKLLTGRYQFNLRTAKGDTILFKFDGSDTNAQLANSRIDPGDTVTLSLPQEYSLDRDENLSKSELKKYFFTLENIVNIRK